MRLIKNEIMLKEIQKEVEYLRVKVYAGQSLEDTEEALYEIEQMLFKAMDKQLNIPIVSQRRKQNRMKADEQTPIEELQKLIDEQIKRITNGIGIDTEIALLKDLQRLSELGVLTVYTSSEIPEIKQEGNTMKVEYLQPRLMFEGEQEIIRLRAELKAHREKYKHTKEDMEKGYNHAMMALAGNGHGEGFDEYYTNEHENK